MYITYPNTPTSTSYGIIALFATNSHVTHTVKGFKIGSSMQSNAFFGQSSFAL